MMSSLPLKIVVTLHLPVAVALQLQLQRTSISANEAYMLAATVVVIVTKGITI
jgi:hypothetical protein